MKNYNKAGNMEPGMSSGTAHIQHGNFAGITHPFREKHMNAKVQRETVTEGSSDVVEGTTSARDKNAASWWEFSLVLLISCIIAVSVILVATISGHAN